MLDERLRHAVDEAHRVAGTFNRARIGQRRPWTSSRRLVQALAAAAAVVVTVIGVGWWIGGIARTDGAPVVGEPGSELTVDPSVVQSPVVGEPGGVISDDPYVVQAPGALPPSFELAQSAVEIRLQPIGEFLPTDASFIRSFVADAYEIVAIGQIADGAHRVFWVTGTAANEVADDGSQTTCIIDTAGHSGSCGTGVNGGTALPFGKAAGGGTDEGLEFVVVMGMVPESTSVVLVTTPHGSFSQVPRAGVAFVVVEASFREPIREPIEWQFFDAAGVVLDAQTSPAYDASMSISDEEIADVALTWVNQLGLVQTDVGIWRDRLVKACDAGVWNHDIAQALAEEFITADLSLSARSEGSKPPSVGEGAQALWLMAVNTCRDRFPASAIEAGPPQP